MAIKIPIITQLQDEGIKRAKREFDKFKGAVSQAEGGLGKFKAGSTAVFDTVKANAATFATAAASAVVGFAVKGVAAFQEVALEAGKFAGATGLSVEEASRLREVAGDLGMEAGAVETALGKMNKAIDPKLFEKLGIEIAYANDGSVDINETFLNVIKRLKDIKDPAQRAKVAAQVLGKGFQSMSQLVEMGSDKLREKLDQVSDAKVITKEELEKARKFRDTMDDLKDITEDLALVLGQTLVPILTFVGTGFKNFADMTNQYVIEPLQSVAGAVSGVVTGFLGLFRKADKKLISDEEVANMQLAREDLDKFNRAALNQIELGKKDIFKDLRESSDKLETAIKNISESWDFLTGQLDNQVSLDNATLLLEELEAAAAKAFGTGAQEDLFEYNKLAADFAGLISTIAENSGKITSREIFLRFKTDPGEALALAKMFGKGGAGELTGLSPEDLLTRSGISTLPRRAMGGTVSPGRSYIVGERGPELLTMGGGFGSVSTTATSSSTINVTVTSADPDEVVRALRQYITVNGSLPLAVR